MITQSDTTKFMADKLKEFASIRKVYYPLIDKIQLKGYGGILFIEVIDEIVNKYNDIMNSLVLFGTGTGMACVTSMIAQPYTGSHASLTEREKHEMGITPNLLRLCFGLEDKIDLLKELQNIL